MICEVCGFRFRSEDNSRMHLHHIRPRGHGGGEESSNKILLCPNCHSIAHILLGHALREGYDIYKLYRRANLIHEIHEYYDESFSYLIHRVYNKLLSHRWFRIKW